jgi:hypothetical protein
LEADLTAAPSISQLASTSVSAQTQDRPRQAADGGSAVEPH